MNYLPSKELLTAIRNDKYIVIDIDTSDIADSKIGYLLDNNQWYFINIYELAHKCKEWTYNDKSLCGYSIELKSYKSEFGYWLCELMSEDITFSGDTEPEAIFAACQWILDNRS